MNRGVKIIVPSGPVYRAYSIWRSMPAYVSSLIVWPIASINGDILFERQILADVG